MCRSRRACPVRWRAYVSGERQRIIEVIARRLFRAVAIDDLQFRLLAYTAHGSEVDAVRTCVILDREAPAWTIQWLRRLHLPGPSAPCTFPETRRAAYGSVPFSADLTQPAHT